MRIYIPVLFCSLVLSCESKKKSGEPKEKHIATVSKKKQPTPADTIVKHKDHTPQYSNKYYSNLSENFNFRLKIHNLGGFVQSDLKLRIYSKADSLIQTINTCTSSSYSIIKYSEVRSFETHFNEKKQIMDEYHGELVVGDFNFDSLTDIALIYNIPVSGTPSYTFYFQTTAGKFEKNRFYSNTVCYIPVKRSYEKRTFVAQSHSGCCSFYFDYYKVDSLGKCVKTYKRVEEF